MVSHPVLPIRIVSNQVQIVSTPIQFGPTQCILNKCLPCVIDLVVYLVAHHNTRCQTIPSFVVITKPYIKLSHAAGSNCLAMLTSSESVASNRLFDYLFDESIVR